MRMAEYSRDCLLALRIDTGIQYEQRTQGTLQLFRTQAQLDAVQRALAVLEECGLPYTLLDRIAVETDTAQRQRLISEASRMLRDDVAFIPLHQQQIVWAVRQGWNVVQTADNYFQLRHVRHGQ